MANAPIPAVSVALRDKNHFLLVKRGRAPSKDYWAFPGGRVEPGETLDEAVRRELAEETGLVAQDYRILRMIPLSGEWGSFDLHIFSAVVCGNTNAVAADDAADAGWFDVNDMATMQVTPSTIEIAEEILRASPSSDHVETSRSPR
ncbi:NUDIX domain-containing protein [Tianweitania sp. BSSL-BM11]|uniref:NUDIX domain-containing protein n=1 Tax=Tianweitania aestuarii TaxID=2814886 RepID=A0ABS5RSC5_9HYPH|nr:NUDIX domain-containing protein [Tianweitania aestuarii]MBS9719955.1 NUDIX domain-containing protein [Tianweitania aestuarii]